MRRFIHASLTALGAVFGLAACGYVDSYEEAVYDLEPRYCYQSIGKVVCFEEPYHRDKERLVSYTGPHPSRYDAPPEPPAPNLIAPPDTGVWVKDPEPVVLTSAEEQGGGRFLPAAFELETPAPPAPAVQPAVTDPAADAPAFDDDGPSWLFDIFGDATDAPAAEAETLTLEIDPTALPKAAVDPVPLAPVGADTAPL